MAIFFTLNALSTGRIKLWSQASFDMHFDGIYIFGIVVGGPFTVTNTLYRTKDPLPPNLRYGIDLFQKRKNHYELFTS